MRIRDVEQRTDAWRDCRLGRLTGSRAKAMLATIQKGEAATRRDLRMSLVVERLTRTPQDNDFVTADMAWGTAHEGEAIAAYEAEYAAIVMPIGFCEHDTLMAGTSPDGFVGVDGILSVKCPRSANHVRYMRDGCEPSEHAAQNTHELWLTGRAWIDFVSFDPRMPERLRLWRTRVTRTANQLKDYEAQAIKFLAECDLECAALLTMSDLSATLAQAVTA